MIALRRGCRMDPTPQTRPPGEGPNEPKDMIEAKD